MRSSRPNRRPLPRATARWEAWWPPPAWEPFRREQRIFRDSKQKAVPTVEDTLGRRVKTDVRGAAGTLIAPAGQIVTQAVIDRAKQLGKAQELLAAVQLGAPVTQRLGRGSQVSAGLQNAQETSANLLGRARTWLDRTQEQAAEAVEEWRIEQAVGRPANQMVLNKQDQIILDIGEIITHKAIEQTRNSDVLGILLGSFSTDAPAIDQMSVRPDEHGRAALDSQPEQEKPVIS
ncbi:hypothetical protein [Deinococcus altitudinis]|uniref:hypothetical protein n=1 Tax=Deinococcus altitudinis TaxID=468914 RepID=UPI003891EBF1